VPEVIKVAAGVYPAEKRKLGRLNLGLYCTHCTEFFAVFVAPQGAEAEAASVVIDLEPGVRFVCPMCQTEQERQSSEVAYLLLTPDNKRRPPPPRDAN
jgi:hypothetical protein